EAARICKIAHLPGLFAALDPLGRLVGEDEAIAALADPLQRRTGGKIVYPALEIGAPVVGLHFAQSRGNIVEVVGGLAIIAIAHAEESAGEIVDRALAARSRANDPVDIDPDQLALAVIILAALPAAPRLRRTGGDDWVVGGVDQRTPGAARRAGAVGR